MAKVSIIVTSYNHERFITHTLESIAAQSFSDWEVLMWDDASTDAAFEKALSCTKDDTRFKIWKHQNNLWIVGNMNFLLSQVSPESEYIAFLEWDDRFEREYIATKLQVFESYPEVALVYNNLDFIDEHGQLIEKNALKNTPKFVKNETLSQEDFVDLATYYYSYSSLMVRKQVLDHIKITGNNEQKLWSVSDWDLFFRISTRYPVFWISDSLTLYTKHGNNFTKIKRGTKKNPILRDMLVLIENYKTQGIISTQIYEQFLGTLLYALSFEYLFFGEKKLALKTLVQSFHKRKKIRIKGWCKFCVLFIFGNIIIKHYE